MKSLVCAVLLCVTVPAFAEREAREPRRESSVVKLIKRVVKAIVPTGDYPTVPKP